MKYAQIYTVPRNFWLHDNSIQYFAMMFHLNLRIVYHYGYFFDAKTSKGHQTQFSNLE